MKGMTFSQLADAINVQRSGISHFVSGRNKPSLEFILKILNYFPEVNPDWLLLGKNPVLRESVQIQDQSEMDIQTTVELGSEGSGRSSGNSFPDDLFSKTELEDISNRSKEPQSAESQDSKVKIPRKKEFRQVKSDASVDKPAIHDNPVKKNRMAERIVVFYNNNTFREYLPEE